MPKSIIWRTVASLIATVLSLTAIAADEAHNETESSPKLVIVPVKPSARPPAAIAPITPCPGTLCGLDDVWKRDALKHERPATMDSSSVVIDRAHFEAEKANFGDPHAPLVMEYKLPSLGICFGGYSVDGGFGIRTC